MSEIAMFLLSLYAIAGIIVFIATIISNQESQNIYLSSDFITKLGIVAVTIILMPLFVMALFRREIENG